MVVKRFEIVNQKQDEFIVFGYASIVPSLVVFLQINFDADDCDAVYGDAATTVLCSVATSFKVDEVYVDGSPVQLEDSLKDDVMKEASEIFSQFKGEEYDDVLSGLSGGGKMKKGGILRKLNNDKKITVEAIFSNPNRFIPYDGTFLYPPRIEHKLQPASLIRFDDGKYIGQPKFDGSSVSVAISEDKAIAKERHNTFFAIPPTFDFKALHRGNGFMCLTGEFMNKSKKDEKGQAFKGFCIWDITAFDGKILIGSTIEERVELLKRLYPSTGELTTASGTPYAFKTNVPFIFRAANIYSNFVKTYKELSSVDMIEGFVLKRIGGKLEMMRVEKNNTGWVVKVRKATNNYEF